MSQVDKDLIGYRLRRAQETLEDAALLLENRRLHSAVNRLYYALFYGVLALLQTKGLSSSKHKGVRALLNREFVKTGLLPREFVDYLRGAIPYYQGNMSEARAAWEAMLDLPASQRRYRSTWAAFMIGKSWLQSDPAQAIVWFERVRELAQQGFIDSLGLAAASLGWQARAELDRKRYSQAIELYLAQFATGDPTAFMSLIQAANKIFVAVPKTLQQVASHPTAQRVITAFVIARGGPNWVHPTSASTYLIKVWLDAYGEAIQKERDRHLSANKRAKALWKAAQIARYEGQEACLNDAYQEP